MKKLAIISSHPIQYNAPWFRLLAQRKKVELKVFYTWSQAKEKVQDKVFGKAIQWDIPLTDGYDHTFVENIATDPGTHHKKGIICPDLIQKVKEWHPTEILVFGWYLKSHFDVMRHFKGKVTLSFRGDSTLIDEVPGWRQKLRRIYLTYVYRHVDRVYYVGIENKKYFIKHGVTEDQLIFAPHAIDNKRFCGTEGSKYEDEALMMRENAGLKAKDTVVLFAGKFEQKKSPILLINAIQKLNNDSQNKIKLVMLGSGPLQNEIKEFEKKDDNIVLLPFQNQSLMPAVYRMGDIVCLPSGGPGETWGLAVNEAYACARPVIVSDKVGCATDLVKDKPFGAVFQSGNVDDLKAKLMDMINQDLKKMGENAQAFIQDWSFEKICEAIEKE